MSRRLFICPWVDRGQGEKLEIVALVKVGAFEGLDRNAGPSRERHGVEGELRHGVRLFGRVGLVIQDVQIP